VNRPVPGASAGPASATATPTSAKDTTMSNHAPARHRAEAAASTFRRRQRRVSALGYWQGCGFQ
jgi:hypothetical protein